MKKSKKWISLVLSVVMVLSTMTVAFTAFAADDAALQTMRDEIKEVTTLSDLQGLALAGAFKALPDEDKDKLGAEWVDKMYGIAYNEALKSLTTGTQAAKVAASVATSKAVLGDYTPKMKEAAVLRNKIDKGSDTGYAWSVKDNAGVSYNLALDPSYVYNVNFMAYGVPGVTGPVTVTPDMQRQVLNAAIAAYSAVDATVKEYMDAANVDGNYINTKDSIARTRISLAVCKNEINFVHPYATNVPAPIAPVAPKAPTEPKDSTWTAYNDEVKLYTTAIMMNGWGDPSILESLGVTLAQAEAHLATLKTQKAEKDAAHEAWMASDAGYQDYLVIKAKYDIDKAAYDALKKAYDADLKVWNAAKVLYDGENSRKAFDELIKTFSPRTQETITAVYEVLAVYEVYLKDSSTVNKNATLRAYEEKYSNLPLFTKEYVVNKLTYEPKTYVLNGQVVSLGDALKAVSSLYDVEAVEKFAAEVLTLELPSEKSFAFNETITLWAAKYKNLNAALVDNGKFQKNYPEASAAYQKLLAMRLYYTQTERDVTIHEKADAYKGETAALNGRNLSNVLGLLLPNASGVAAGVIGSLMGNPTAKQDALSNVKIFTNDNVTALLKLLFPLVAGIDLGGIKLAFGPKDLAKELKEAKEGEKYLAATAALEAAGMDWTKLPDTGIDWKVTAGNEEQFLNAFIAGLRPFTTLLTSLLKIIPNNYSYAEFDTKTNVDFKYGAYEYVIIPLLEALGVKDVMTSDEYTVAVTNEFIRTGTGDGQVKLIVDQLMPLVRELLADPLNTLATILPNLVYHLQDGCIFDGIRAAVKLVDMGLENDPMIKDLSFDSILALLQPTLAGLGVNIADLQIDKIAKFGTAKDVASKVVNAGDVVKITADKTSVFNFLANTIDAVVAGLGTDLGAPTTFVKSEAPKYPHNGKMDKKVMNTMVDGLDGILGGLFNINDLLNSGVCTEKMAAQAIEGIYKLIGGINLTAIGLTLPIVRPLDVAAFLDETKYAAIKEELAGKTSWADVGLYLANGTETIYQTKMGFKDGDRQGFLDCLVAALRPISKALADAGTLTNVTKADGSESKGLYDVLIIPIFEDLGIAPATDAATYTNNFTQLMKKTDKNFAYDYLLNTILAPVLKLLGDFAAAPAKTLMKMLPNIAYQAEHGTLLALLSGLLGTNNKLDLGTLLNGVLGGLIPGLELPALDLDTIASCGTMKTEKKSMSSARSTYTVIEGDSADAFVTVFNYIYDTFNYKNNLKAVKTLVSTIEGMDKTMSGLVDSLLNQVFTAPKEESLCMLGTLLAADVWECPDQKNGNDNGNGSGSGNKTPATGETAISAIALMSVLFAAGAAIVVLKKKKVNAD